MRAGGFNQPDLARFGRLRRTAGFRPRGGASTASPKTSRSATRAIGPGSDHMDRHFDNLDFNDFGPQDGDGFFPALALPAFCLPLQPKQNIPANPRNAVPNNVKLVGSGTGSMWPGGGRS